MVAQHSDGLAGLRYLVDIDVGDQYTPTYKAINPQSAVPSLFIDDGAPLTQSLAILEYLAERFPDAGLWPRDRGPRATARSISAKPRKRRARCSTGSTAIMTEPSTSASWAGV